MKRNINLDNFFNEKNRNFLNRENEKIIGQLAYISKINILLHIKDININDGSVPIRLEKTFTLF
jgi:hypothetical protein